MALTDKQRRFVEEYLIDLNATQAAIRAGYSAKAAQGQGSRLLSNAMVARAVAEGAHKRATKAEVTAQDVLIGLHREATREGDGASHAARVSAWGLLGKYHKLFTDRIEAEVSLDVTVTDARSKLRSLLARQPAARGTGSGTGGADG
ncbi:terminase small subunit [Aurantimonas coralicida]|uniref:terminase small subunit n=1 Tax=Aurantimonas coralicida TaxID=182270 RepID=UPI002E7C46EE|nr:terminase small subunit [Aurantimonas coralicida]MCD1645266.1 terminase small subunit [Aurantimonas coralicida]